VAAAGGGLVLYLTAPASSAPEASSRDASLYIAPSIGPNAGLVVLGGRY